MQPTQTSIARWGYGDEISNADRAPALEAPWYAQLGLEMWSATRAWTTPENNPLTAREKALVNLAILAMTGRDKSIRSRCHGLLRAGFAVEELAEVFRQISAYGGMPMGTGGSLILAEAERDLKEAGVLPLTSRSEGFTDHLPYAVSHVNIGVVDMEASLRFYRDGLGLKVSVDQVEHEGTDREERAVYLRYDDELNFVVVVLDQLVGREPFGTPPVLKQNGLNHFGLWVNEIEPILERLRNLGFDVPEPSPRVNPGSWYGVQNGSGMVRNCMLTDPDGGRVQLDQWVEPPTR